MQTDENSHKSMDIDEYVEELEEENAQLCELIVKAYHEEFGIINKQRREINDLRRKLKEFQTGIFKL